MLARMGFALVTVCATLAAVPSAEARVDIHVDLGSQTMRVESESGSYVWPISSARAGYSTPLGTFGIQRMEAMHRSHKYHNSPMPHSLFFSGGYAIHGTYEIAALGEPASHGCIRIAPENAAALYEMVGAEGGRISIEGSGPSADHYARRERTRYAGRRYGRDQDRPFATYDGDGSQGYEPSERPVERSWLDDLGGF